MGNIRPVLTEADVSELLSFDPGEEVVKLCFGEDFAHRYLRGELRKLELAGSAVASRVLTTIEPVQKKFNPLEARGWGGRWTSGKATDAQFRKAQIQAEKKVRAAPKPTPEEVEANKKLIANSKRAGGELRGSSTDRARRKAALLKEFGNGTHAPCVYCGARLDKHTVTEDKIYTGHEGGRYRMSNLLPACRSCNNHRGDTPMQLKWFKTRSQIEAEQHRRIIDAVLKGHEPEEHPTVLFLGGGPASGKSSIGTKTGVNIDIDDLMARLPGYKEAVANKDPKAAVKYHAEASNLAREVRAAAYKKHVSFTLDGVGDTGADRMRRVIKEARDKGYTVHGRYFTVPTDEAIRRSDERAKATGRVVPHDVIRSLHRNVSRTLPAVAHEFDHLELYDNSGKEPKLIMHSDASDFHIHDPAAVQAFIDKGQGDVHKSAGSVIRAAREEALAGDDNIQLPYDYADEEL